LGVEGAVEQIESFLDEDVNGVFGFAGFVEPAGGRLLVFEGRESANRGRPG